MLAGTARLSFSASPPPSTLVVPSAPTSVVDSTTLPAFAWIASELDIGWAVVAALLVFIPHLVVDDGRIVRLYLNRVKHVEGFDVGVASSVDQSFHVLSLWLVALLMGAA